MSHDEYDYIFKLVIVGHGNVGKTSLFLRFINDSYSEYQYSTMGIDFKIKIINVEGKLTKLQIWIHLGLNDFEQ